MARIPRIRTLTALAFVPGLGLGALQAQTAIDTFGVTITIEADCEITSTETLDFETAGVLTQEVLATADIVVTCTPDTDYTVALNAGVGTGATTTVRKMTEPSVSATVDYEMYRDSARTLNWGNTPPTDTVGATGNGAAQTHTVYGRVPPQATPIPATYEDTITVTVGF